MIYYLLIFELQNKTLDQIWFEILFESCFKPGIATCRYPIRGYRFGQIGNMERWIKFRSMAQISPYPFGLSDLSGPLDHDRTAKKERRGSSLVRSRVPAIFSGEAHWCWAPAGLLGLLDGGDATTGSSGVRRARSCGPQRGSLPGEGVGVG
jgi:hypothetical protein